MFTTYVRLVYKREHSGRLQTSKDVNISDRGRRGGSRGHDDRSLRGTIMRGKALSKFMEPNVPSGEQQLPAYVRSLPGRSEAKGGLFMRWGAHRDVV